MKILIIHRTLGMLLGGGEMFIVRLAEHLQKQDIDVSLLVGQPLFKKVKYKYDFLNIKYITSPYLWNLGQIHLSRYLIPLDYNLFEKAVLKYLDKYTNNYDLILVCFYANLAYKIKKRYNKKVLYFNPGLPSKENLFYSRKIDAIITHGDGLNSFKGFDNVFTP